MSKLEFATLILAFSLILIFGFSTRVISDWDCHESIESCVMQNLNAILK